VKAWAAIRHGDCEGGRRQVSLAERSAAAWDRTGNGKAGVHSVYLTHEVPRLLCRTVKVGFEERWESGLIFAAWR